MWHELFKQDLKYIDHTGYILKFTALWYLLPQGFLDVCQGNIIISIAEDEIGVL